MLELLSNPNAWMALATLTVMEIVLGIDNVIFISVIVERLPEHQAKRARQLGLALALIFRILLLLALSWLIGLSEPLFEVFDHTVSWRDIILVGGGIFLISDSGIAKASSIVSLNIIIVLFRRIPSPIPSNAI